jgi:hypothetical protein
MRRWLCQLDKCCGRSVKPSQVEQVPFALSEMNPLAPTEGSLEPDAISQNVELPVAPTDDKTEQLNAHRARRIPTRDWITVDLTGRANEDFKFIDDTDGLTFKNRNASKTTRRSDNTREQVTVNKWRPTNFCINLIAYFWLEVVGSTHKIPRTRDTLRTAARETRMEQEGYL